MPLESSLSLPSFHTIFFCLPDQKASCFPICRGCNFHDHPTLASFPAGRPNQSLDIRRSHHHPISISCLTSSHPLPPLLLDAHPTKRWNHALCVHVPGHRVCHAIVLHFTKRGDTRCSICMPKRKKTMFWNSPKQTVTKYSASNSISVAPSLQCLSRGTEIAVPPGVEQCRSWARCWKPCERARRHLGARRDSLRSLIHFCKVIHAMIVIVITLGAEL